MEFEDERHDEEEEEEEDDDEEMGLPPSYDPSCLKMGGDLVLAHHNQQAGPTARPRYRECLKNHAVGLGGHALDGCGEFLAAGPDGTLDALKCAACNCHRNFHRKLDDLSSGGAAFPFSPFYRAPTGYLHVAPPHLRPLALPSTSGGGGAEDRDDGGGGSSSARKRFRTKFTAEQKERMLELAERLGWRIQKHDEAVVQQFCDDSGVKRQVLKVWMHNNKHTLGKKP